MHGSSAAPVLGGLFVGGASRRMGGRPKGLLPGPSGESLVARWAGLFAAIEVPLVLVGEHEAYAGVGLPCLRDEGADLGPLGGLLALLARAGGGRAVAVACDMPYVSEGLLRRLLSAPPAPAVAARRDARWEPFFARYDAARVLPVARARASRRERALQGLLDQVGATELPLSAAEARELRDWDTPQDVARGR